MVEVGKGSLSIGKAAKHVKRVENLSSKLSSGGPDWGLGQADSGPKALYLTPLLVRLTVFNSRIPKHLFYFTFFIHHYVIDISYLIYI